MTFKAYFPRRGDIVSVNTSPSAGHELAGRHYALVLSPAEYNRRSGMAVLLMATSKTRQYAYELEIPAGLISPTKDNPSGKGYLLCDAVRQIDWRERGISFVAAAPEEFTNHALDALLSLLDSTENPQ
jgi:mRNA interferase MazF